ncbi:hypothetical protein [Enhygromyxa salina]|uniref:Uncharacterized protein n=1 Tax=Enhygromyxa salina TaxID=215803 RepID=A0A2S9YT86_9BACT|nr:hypothetical protein [Enhygromyxa salina]PRQ08317.1 hypothetical protein ENSA7_19400 [Enhygromyxa salina]
MPRPARGDWVALGFVLLGVPVAFLQPAAGAIWIALWLGTAIMLIASRQQLPRFLPRKNPIVMQNLDPTRVERAPTPYGGWWLIFPFTLTGTVAPAALISPDGGVMAFAVPSALMLITWLGFALAHEREASKIVSRILRASSKRRIVGAVSGLGGRFARAISWHSWSGVHHGTAEVASVHGGTQTVATVTHTTNTLGYREEVRHPFNLAGTRIAVDTQHLHWASESRGGPDQDSPLRTKTSSERGMLAMLAQVGVDREVIGKGDRVVVVAPAEEIAQGQLRGSTSDPLLVFAVPGDADPIRRLKQLRAVRSGSALAIAACLAAVIWAAVARPASPAPAEPQPLAPTQNSATVPSGPES